MIILEKYEVSQRKVPNLGYRRNFPSDVRKGVIIRHSEHREMNLKNDKTIINEAIYKQLSFFIVKQQDKAKFQNKNKGGKNEE